MAFIRIDGFEIDAMIDNFDLTDEAVESFGRATNDSLEGVTYSEKKAMSFTTKPLKLEDAVAVEGWIRGLQNYWSFERTYNPGVGVTTAFTKTSSDAGYSVSGGTLSGTSPMWGNQRWDLMVHSGATAGATTFFGSEGHWTVHGYHLSTTSTWQSFGVRSFNGGFQGYLNGASISTVPFLSVSAASGYLGAMLCGKTRTGTNATAQYTALSFSRYPWTEGMLLAASTPPFGLASTGYTRKPFITVTGDALQSRSVSCNGAGEPGPMIAKGFVETFDVMPVTLDGAFRYNARALKVRLTEK